MSEQYVRKMLYVKVPEPTKASPEQQQEEDCLLHRFPRYHCPVKGELPQKGSFPNCVANVSSLKVTEQYVRKMSEQYVHKMFICKSPEAAKASPEEEERFLHRFSRYLTVLLKGSFPNSLGLRLKPGSLVGKLLVSLELFVLVD